MMGVLIERGHLNTDTQGEGYVNIGVMLSQAKELPEDRRMFWNRVCPSGCQREKVPIDTLNLDFQPPEP